MPKLPSEDTIRKMLEKNKKKRMKEEPAPVLEEQKTEEIPEILPKTEEIHDLEYINRNTENYEPLPEQVISDKDYKKLLKTINAKQLRFVENYLESMNITRAYQLAYKQKNANCAIVSGSNLLKNIKIQQLITYKLRKRAEKKGYSREDRIASITALRDAAIKDKQYFAASKCEELLSKIMGDLDKKQALSGDNLVIVKSYVVPSFKNVSSAPQQNKDDIKALIEEYLRARA